MQEVHVESHRDEELFDLLHGISHPIIGIWDGSHHLNEHMQLHGQVSIFGFTALPELFFLTRQEEQIRKTLEHNMKAIFLGTKQENLNKPCSCLSWNLYPELKSWHQCPPAVSWLCCLGVPKAYQQSLPVGPRKITSDMYKNRQDTHLQRENTF